MGFDALTASQLNQLIQDALAGVAVAQDMIRSFDPSFITSLSLANVITPDQAVTLFALFPSPPVPTTTTMAPTTSTAGRIFPQSEYKTLCLYFGKLVLQFLKVENEN